MKLLALQVLNPKRQEAIKPQAAQKHTASTIRQENYPVTDGREVVFLGCVPLCFRGRYSIILDQQEYETH